MSINWEAVAAIASLISSLAVVGAIALAVRQLNLGVHQVRVGTDQVDQLRRATQLDGAMKIFALLTAPEQISGRRYISERLRQRFSEDEVYRRDLLTMSGDFDAHPELPVMRLMEIIGVYVKHGLLDENIIFDFWLPSISRAWDELTSLGVIEAQRAIEPAMFVNFEGLVTRYRAWESAPVVGRAAAPSSEKA